LKSCKESAIIVSVNK